MNAISWMDERSTEECALLEERFPPARVEAVTGQAAVLPTWPATKILWLRRHRTDVYAAAGKYMLLKDYVVYRLTGRRPIAPAAPSPPSRFILIFMRNVTGGEMLEAIGVREEQLPPLVEPCTVAGSLTADVTRRLEIAFGTQVNVGHADHFAGMIGTGNAPRGHADALHRHGNGAGGHERGARAPKQRHRHALRLFARYACDATVERCVKRRRQPGMVPQLLHAGRGLCAHQRGAARARRR